MKLITIAMFGKPFGLQGEVHLYLHTDFPELRFKKGRAYVLISPNGEQSEVHLASFTNRGNKYTAKFKEFTRIEDVEDLSGYELALPEDQAPLPEGAYRFANLIGFECVDQDGNHLGKLVEVTDYAPTKNLKIQMDNKKHFYVPFLDQFIPSIDEEHQTIVINVVEGMLP